MENALKFQSYNNYTVNYGLSACLPDNGIINDSISIVDHAIQEDILKGEMIGENAVKQALYDLKLITLEITTRCNMGCKYCIQGGVYKNEVNEKSYDMQFAKARNLIDYLVGVWKSSSRKESKNTLIGFHGGEPLVNIELIKAIVNYVKSIDRNIRGFNFSMVTNGVLLDKYIDYLFHNNISFLISLDGNHYNNSYRVFKNGKASFNKVINNIDLVKNKYPEYFNNSVGFISVLHDRNSKSDIKEFIRNRFGKMPVVNELEIFDVEKQSDFKQLFNRKKIYINSLRIDGDKGFDLKNTGLLKSFLKKKSNNVFDSYNDLLYDKQNPIYLKRTCQPFGKKLFLSVHGDIAFCQSIFKRHNAGKVTDTSVLIDYKEIVREYNELVRKMLTYCFECYFPEDCTQCMFKVIDEDGKIDCPQRVQKDDYIHYLSLIWRYFESFPEEYEEFVEEYKPKSH